MPAVNPNELEDLLEERDSRREMKRARKKLADGSEKRPAPSQIKQTKE